jgi:hypothetical protein
MIIVKCNPKVPFKIYNLWIQVKKFFKKNKFKNSFFMCVFIHINLFLFLFCTCAKTKKLMSEFLCVWVCVYISLKPNSKIQLLRFVLISILFFHFYLSPCVLIKIYHRLDLSFSFLFFSYFYLII